MIAPLASPLNIIFMGTPEFAAVALQKLIVSGHNIIACYTQPARPKGRGMALQLSPVEMLAHAHNISVFTPLSFKKDAAAVAQFQALVKESGADIAVVAAYGLILPDSVLNAPRLGCLNIHGSLLPRWRGASPIQHAVWYDDIETGVTIMQMTKGLDEGPMITKGHTKIAQKNTAALYDELAIMGGDLVCDVLDKIAREDNVAAEPQDETHVTYARMLSKEDGHVNWNLTAREIDCAVRALNPWPSTYALNVGKRFKIATGEIVVGLQHTATIGTILNEAGDVACGNGTMYRLCIVQPDNKKQMPFHDALQGQFFNVGDVLQ